jgi:hemoglobin-like flavoprotein
MAPQGWEPSMMDLQVLRDSFNRLAPRADALAQTFYVTLFERHPDVVPLFDGVQFDDQRRKLVRALALVVRHLEQPDFLRAYLHGLGAIHLAYGVVPAHYDAVGECLLAALAQTAGKSWSAEEDAAWRAAFALISDAMLAGAAKVA